MSQYVILLIAKSTIVLGLGFVLTSLLRSAAASTRYAVWALTFAAVAALPVATALAPAWRIAIAPSPVSPSIESDVPMSTSTAPVSITTPATSGAAVESAVANVSESVASSSAIPPQALIIVIWIAGLMFVTARIIAGRYSLQRIVRRATPLTTTDWMSLVARESEQLRLQHDVSVFSSENVSTPLAAGLRSPVIVLPHDADSWTREHRQVVLRHELVHIARGDALVCLLAGIACAVYWFNPFVWLASRKLRTEQERSCDDRVLALGTPATDYAEHLLEVARSARDMGMHSFVSVAMARPSQLEGRLLAVLQNRRRGPLGRRRAVMVSVAAVAALSAVSALRPVRAESAIVVASQADSPVLINTIATVADREAIAAPRIEQLVVDSVITGDVVASSGGTLVLDLKTGAGVRITGVNENRVRMRAMLGGRDWRNTVVTMDAEEDGARVTSDWREQRTSTSSSHRMEITVPRRFNIRIKSAGGTVFIRDLEGDFTGTTGGGEINIENSRGSARLTTGGGPVNVMNSNLSGSVTTGGGAVLIQGVTGGLVGHSGSGGVFYGRDGVTFSEVSSKGIARTTDGRLFVNKSGGDVRINDAPNGATISTGGGRVTIGNSGGDVSVSTGGGDVTIGSASKKVKIQTGAGDVRTNITGTGGYPVEVETGNGTVTLTLPAGLSAELDLETAFTNNHRGATRIESDWPLSTTITPDWDAREGTPRRYVRARQTIGSGGARITVKTVNGDIIIRRR